MKRREVETALRKAGCVLVSDSGSHTEYGCPCGRHTTAVPRHKEITAGVVGSISKQLACLPEGLLQ
ncbi:type II toxin-antitoxin system HicA family toxin [Lentzea sp. DG1S-22]|uniref:type II toxin-antitoxin system HicA family toxin n=1 Tax=Lentzea sp. DG1S-22 TaxID=3108822 RepID=UPI003FA5AE75